MLIDKTRIIIKHYPIEEEVSAIVTRSCSLEKDNRVSAQILWYHQGELVVSGGTRELLHNNETLKFSPIRSPNDQGQFTCQVFSDAGNAAHSFNITIIEVPLKMEPSAVLASEPRAINITWSAPINGNLPILRYQIEYRENTTCKSQL